MYARDRAHRDKIYSSNMWVCGPTRKKQVLSNKREEMKLMRKKPQERTKKQVLY